LVAAAVAPLYRGDAAAVGHGARDPVVVGHDAKDPAAAPHDGRKFAPPGLSADR
jgi:hypothetical protein